MKTINIIDVNIKKSFTKNNIKYFNEINNIIYHKNGIAGNIEKGCNLNDFKFIISNKALKKLDKYNISINKLKKLIFNKETEIVEVYYKYNNILFTYRVDKDLNSYLMREATYEEIEEFERKENKKIDNYINELNNIELFIENSIEYKHYIELTNIQCFIKNNKLKEKVKNLLNSFFMVIAYDLTIFYIKKGIKSINIKKEKLNNIDKFIGKEDKNIKLLQKEIGVKIKLV